MSDVRIRNVRVRIRGGSAAGGRRAAVDLRGAVVRALAPDGASGSPRALADRIATPIAGAVRDALRGRK